MRSGIAAAVLSMLVAPALLAQHGGPHPGHALSAVMTGASESPAARDTSGIGLATFRLNRVTRRICYDVNVHTTRFPQGALRAQLSIGVPRAHRATAQSTRASMLGMEFAAIDGARAAAPRGRTVRTTPPITQSIHAAARSRQRCASGASGHS